MTVPWLKLSVRDFASQSLKIFAIGKRNDRFLGSNYPWFCFSQLANLRNLDSAMILSWLKLLVRNFASQSLEIFAIWKALWPFFGSNFCLRFRSQNLKIFILWDPGHRGGLGRESCEQSSHSPAASFALGGISTTPWASRMGNLHKFECTTSLGSNYPSEILLRKAWKSSQMGKRYDRSLAQLLVLRWTYLLQNVSCPSSRAQARALAHSWM